MDPQLSGFALGLLFAAAKVGALATIGFAIAWWRTRRKLQQLERALPDPSVLEERLASLERNSDYIAARVGELGEGQRQVLRQLTASLRLPEPAPRDHADVPSPVTPR